MPSTLIRSGPALFDRLQRQLLLVDLVVGPVALELDGDVDALGLLRLDELRDQHVLGELRAGTVLAALDRVRADHQLDLLGVGVAVRVLVAAAGVRRARGSRSAARWRRRRERPAGYSREIRRIRGLLAGFSAASAGQTLALLERLCEDFYPTPGKTLSPTPSSATARAGESTVHRHPGRGPARSGSDYCRSFCRCVKSGSGGSIASG